jgi:hypothetical protein
VERSTADQAGIGCLKFIYQGLMAMNVGATTKDATTHNLIILLCGGTQVLMWRDQGLQLPEVGVNGKMKFAQQITEAIRTQFGLETVYLFPETTSPLHNGEHHYQVLELLNDAEVTSGLEPVAVGSINSQDVEPDTVLAIRTAVERCFHADSNSRFEHFGWFEQLQEWVERELRAHGRSLSNRFQHVKGSGKSILVRFETDQGAVWFKAPPQLRAHELGTTLLLSELCPEQLPRILATKPDWNGWLMEEVGVSLHDIPVARHPYRQIVEALAELQIRTSSATDRLKESGCRECGLISLETQIDPLIVTIQQVMKQQSTPNPRPLQEREIQDLRHHLHAACEYLGEFQVPDTILHGDLTDGSILAEGERIAFTDWEQAYIGNALFNFQYICAYQETHHPESVTTLRSLRPTYLERLEQAFDVRELTRAFVVVPLLTLLADICGTSSWSHPDFQSDPDGGKYLRSRARQMFRETQAPEFVETQCLTRS